MCRVTVRVVAALVVVTAFARPSLVQADEQATIEKIVTTWKERGAKAKTIVIEMAFKRTEAAGVLLSGLEEPPKFSEKDFVCEGTRKVWFDGDKMRDVLTHVAWHDKRNAYLPLEQTEVFDGNQGRALYQGQDLLSGVLLPPNKQNTYRQNLELAPFMKQFRGFAPSVAAFTIDRWKLSKPETVDGRECITIEENRLPLETRYQKYWVDTERGSYIVRQESYWQEAVESRLTIAYAEDGEWGWLPKSWRTERYREGKLVKFTDTTLKTVKFNVDVDPATFELEFPPGTTVSAYGVGMYVVPKAAKP